MKRILYRLFSVVLLGSLAAACSKDKISKFSAREMSTNAAAGTFDYYQFTNLPEQVIDVTGRTRYDRSTNRVYQVPYVLGKSSVPGGHPIYRYNIPFTYDRNDLALGGSFSVISGPNGGGATKIAVAQYTNSGDGSMSYFIYAIDDQNRLWYSRSGGGPVGQEGYSWTDTQILASDMAIGYSSAGEIRIYTLGVDNVYGGHRIYRLLTNSAGQYQPSEIIPGSAATSLAVTGNRLAVVNSLHQIFVNDNPQIGGSFIQLPGSGIDISGDSYSIGLIGDRAIPYGYEIFRRDAATATNIGWQQSGGAATQIGSNSDSDFYVVNEIGEVFWAKYR